MRHIFKRLHIGSNHDPNRGNESSAIVSPTCAADHRLNSGQSPSSPPTSSPSGAEPVVSTPAASAVNRQDYYSSEEEYQVQIALALSVSGPDSRNDPVKDQIRATTLPSSSARERDVAADLLSRQYWVS